MVEEPLVNHLSDGQSCQPWINTLGCLIGRAPLKYKMKWLLGKYPAPIHKLWFGLIRG